jgi:hypothetical protein
MPLMSIVNQAKGPLTVSATFKAPTDGTACFVVSAPCGPVPQTK